MPFDYPLVTAFGRHGATDVMVAIAEQRLRTVCLTSRASAEHTPLRLERYVEEHMLRGRDVGFCILYRR